MPLFYEGQKLDKLASANKKSSATHCLPPALVKVAHEWTQKTLKVVDKDVLYVSQREYGVIDPLSKGRIEYIASDSATTCHIIILIHPESKVVSVSHFDGACTEMGVKDLLSEMDARVSKLCPSPADASAHQYQLYLFGGFNDAKGTSNNLSIEIINALKSCTQLLQVVVLCIGELNSRYDERGVCYPIYYGAGVNCDTLEVHRMECTDRGPLQEVKHCRIFSGPKRMVNCYDHETQEMVVEPFNFRPLDQIELWLKQTDEFLLQYLSTSPEQEPPHFIAGTRDALRCMYRHPQPMRSLFNNSAFRFRHSDGHWVRSDES